MASETRKPRRVTMNAKRTAAIYRAAYGPITDARIAIAKLLSGHPHGERVDQILFRAECKAADAAVRAAGGTP